MRVCEVVVAVGVGSERGVVEKWGKIDGGTLDTSRVR